MPDDLLLVITGPDPHPDLIAAQKPRPRDVAEAAALLGWLPDAPLFRPAVPARREED